MGHWYDSSGKLHTQIVGKNGKTRDVTLRDAKKLKLYASVTTIIAQVYKPGLEIWKQNKLFQAVLANKDIIGSLDWEKQVLKASRLESNTAMVKGTKIHNLLEKYYKGERGTFSDADKRIIKPVVQLVNKEIAKTDTWRAEKTFSCEEGFGGSIDLHSVDKQIILDFKTTGKTEFDDIKYQPDHVMQLAAYRYGLGTCRDSKCFNVHISTSVDGLCCVHEWTAEEVRVGWEMFKALLTYWKYSHSLDI